MTYDAKDVLRELEAMRAAANPPDHSAPGRPIWDMGQFVNQNWPVIRKALALKAALDNLGESNGR